MCEPDIVFDDLGDTKIQVKRPCGLEAKARLVCSRALARSSPVLHVKLQEWLLSENTTSPRLNRLVIELPAGDDDSLTLFLNIAHGRFLEIPRKLSISQLYNLTALTHCYQSTGLLDPWADSWISLIESPARGLNLAKLLWISWELGKETAFTDVAHRMAMELDATELQSVRQLWVSSKTTGVLGMQGAPLLKLCMPVLSS